VVTVRPGDLVAAIVPEGAYAEYTLADARWLLPLPAHLDRQQASALGAPAQVALSVLRAGRPGHGDSVLVHAGAGAIGHLAVQLARLLGSERVIATAGSPEKLDVIRNLGATAAVDYRRPGWSDEVRAATDGDGPDVILNGVGGGIFGEDVRLLAPFGRLVYFGTAAGPAPGVAPHELTSVKYVVGSNFGLWRQRRPATVEANLRELIGYVESGRLRTVIGGVFPLDGAAAAHRAVEDRARVGRIVLKV
jgi:NADPH2:quinone reductase